jgi:hypothetical protein
MNVLTPKLNKKNSIFINIKKILIDYKFFNQNKSWKKKIDLKN